MRVNEALAHHPGARWVFAAYQIGGCSGCASAEDETLEQVAVAYGLSLSKLLEDLNSLFEAESRKQKAEMFSA